MVDNTGLGEVLFYSKAMAALIGLHHSYTGVWHPLIELIR
jgi:hypothetical protein